MNKVVLGPRYAQYLCPASVYGCFCTPVAESSSCDQRPYGPQGQKYLLSGSWQKMCADPLLRTGALEMKYLSSDFSSVTLILCHLGQMT